MSTVLITGASGALGSALVPLFATDADTRVVLLMRAKSPEHLEQRRQQLLLFLRQIGLDASAEPRIEMLQGDISQAQLGLAPDQAARLAGVVTHVIHCAGIVKLNQSMEDARRTAVGSATGVVEFARRCQQAGCLRKLEFVSTVGVGGRTPGLIPEAVIPGPRGSEDFHNTYEAAKWEAERYLLAEAGGDLPLTIHRPSMIVGDSQHGRIIHFQVFYFLTDFLLGLRTRGVVPRTGDSVLDIIPVDYVAKAIHLAATHQLGQGEIWHLCSGPQHSKRLVDLVAELQGMLAKRGEPIVPLKRVPLGVFRLLVRAGRWAAPARSRRFLAGLPFLLDYLSESQFFDNEQTDAKLQAHGLSIPVVDSYLEAVMQPYWDREQKVSQGDGKS